MSTVVIDDHLLRDVLTGDRPHDLDGLATGLATTGLWLFRLTSSFAAPGTVGRPSAPVKALPTSMQEQFRAQLISLPSEIEILHLRDLAWSMAGLQHRHRHLGHQLSAAMVEVLAAAHALGADIAVSERDVGPSSLIARRHLLPHAVAEFSHREPLRSRPALMQYGVRPSHRVHVIGESPTHIAGYRAVGSCRPSSTYVVQGGPSCLCVSSG